MKRCKPGNGIRPVLSLIIVFSLLLFLPYCSLPFFQHKQVSPSSRGRVPLFTPYDGWLRVTTKPEKFLVYFNGKLRYDEAGYPLTSPVLVRLPPGFYQLKLKQEGYLEWADTVEVATKETTKILVNLNALWNREEIRKQEKLALIIGGGVMTLITALGIAFRKVQIH
jgi:hypothetical protein